MLGLLALLALVVAAVIGFADAGFIGAVTGGLVLALLIVSGMAVRSGAGGKNRRLLRVGFLMQFLLISLGAGVGGWHWGWLSGTIGMLIGLAATRGLVLLVEAWRRRREPPANQAPFDPQL